MHACVLQWTIDIAQQILFRSQSEVPVQQIKHQAAVQANTTHENWVGVLQEVGLPGTDGSVESFLKTATDFCNDRCWGSLSASIFVPDTVKKSHPEAVEQAVADLHYGTIVINAPSFMSFALGQMAWGAYPGNQPHVSMPCCLIDCS